MHHSKSGNGRRARRGVATVMILFVVFMALISGLLLASASVLQTRLSAAGQNRLAALTLAEAGVDDAVDRLRQDVGFAGAADTLYQDPPTNVRPFGTFATVVSDAGANTKKVVSTGTCPNGSARQVVALVDVTPRPLGFGAVVSKGSVKMGGTAQFVTTPLPNQHTADIISNQDISMGGGSFADGQLSAAGTVTGTAFYPSISGAETYPFPTAAEITAQQNAYLVQAKTGGTQGGINNAGSNMALTGPVYVNGNITLKNGDSLTLNGGGGTIIYVNGDVNLYNGSTLTNGVTLVVAGTFSQNGGVFTTIPDVLPTPTLIAYSSQSDAISLTGGSTAQNQGVVYAPNGGIKLTGGATFTGALVAGPGGITTVGNYYHYFPDNLASEATLPALPGVTSWLEL